MSALRRLLTLVAFLAAGGAAFAQPVRPPQGGRPIVIGQSYAIASAVLGGQRRLNVYLPPGYADPSKRFPVLFLLDGGEAEDFLHIAGVAQVTAANGAVQEMIVVGVEGVDRRHDLTSPTHDPKDLKAAPTSGGAAAYRRFLVEEAKPWVVAHYRTSGRTALIGESLAGLFTVETFLREPQDFDDYIAASPSLWWDGQALSREAEADLRRGGFVGKRLWFGIGDEGSTMQAGADRLVSALKTTSPAGLQWTYDPRPQERHDTIYDPLATTAIRHLYPVPKP